MIPVGRRQMLTILSVYLGPVQTVLEANRSCFELFVPRINLIRR